MSNGSKVMSCNRRRVIHRPIHRPNHRQIHTRFSGRFTVSFTLIPRQIQGRIHRQIDPDLATDSPSASPRFTGGFTLDWVSDWHGIRAPLPGSMPPPCPTLSATFEGLTTLGSTGKNPPILDNPIYRLAHRPLSYCLLLLLAFFHSPLPLHPTPPHLGIYWLTRQILQPRHETNQHWTTRYRRFRAKPRRIIHRARFERHVAAGSWLTREKLPTSHRPMTSTRFNIQSTSSDIASVFLETIPFWGGGGGKGGWRGEEWDAQIATLRSQTTRISPTASL